MFLFKKIAAPLFFPLSIILEILIFGIFLLWFTRRQKAGKAVVFAGALLLALFSYGSLSDICLKTLEDKYPPLIELETFPDVKWVVVLGGGHNSDPKLPVTSQISESSLSRLVEGIRIHRLLPESRLVLSGGAVFDPMPESRIMAGVANVIGIGDNRLVLEELSKDTKDQARLIHEIVGDKIFILVTSASHMPRSMALFQKSGMRPIPAPADYWVKERQRISPGVFFPNAGSLRKMERVFYEYLGLAWARIRGQI
ncbi:MAG: YdcF family protein [Desulfobacteraceae bacterium]|uniref:YdcF family protein n=1 Tax=Candidatus Desulfaltia bathyphila TaxID=2841697 RepID=A0A8J6N611_9BACT|nr:YdcF family protein [Candidatus Desulfaltia bathyphila]